MLTQSSRTIMACSEQDRCLGMCDWTDCSNANNSLDDDLLAFVQQNKASNTIKKTRSDLNVWLRWCDSVGERRNLEDIPSKDLNNLLGHFAMKIRKQNGEEYEPNTITSYFRSFDRYLKDKS